jgi:AcrR family transcriptional regulator
MTRRRDRTGEEGGAVSGGSSHNRAEHDPRGDVVGTWLPGLHEGLLHPPRQQRSRRSMEQILTAAETVWTRDGPDGLTMAAISQESGISIGGLYSRFDGKQGLLRAVRDRLLTRLENEVAARLRQHDGGVRHTVRGFVACLADSDLRSVLRSLAVGDEDDPELDARGAVARERLLAAFRTAALRDRHELRHRDPDLALSMAFHVVLGCLTTADRTVNDPDLIRDETTQVCLAYLCGPGH